MTEKLTIRDRIMFAKFTGNAKEIDAGTSLVYLLVRFSDPKMTEDQVMEWTLSKAKEEVTRIIPRIVAADKAETSGGLAATLEEFKGKGH